MASKKTTKKVTKKTKKVTPKVEMVTMYSVILLGSKFNRADELEMALNMGFKYEKEIASRAGVYVVLSKEVEVVDCDECVVE